MGMFKYITNRTLQSSKGREDGRIKVLVRQESDNAEVDYICPECGKSEHTEQAWRRPFSVKCGGCGFLMRLPKLREEVKKEKKLARA